MTQHQYWVTKVFDCLNELGREEEQSLIVGMTQEELQEWYEKLMTEIREGKAITKLFIDVDE